MLRIRFSRFSAGGRGGAPGRWEGSHQGTAWWANRLISTSAGKWVAALLQAMPLRQAGALGQWHVPTNMAWQHAALTVIAAQPVLEGVDVVARVLCLVRGQVLEHLGQGAHLLGGEGRGGGR